MNHKDKNINMMIKVIKDCLEHREMGTPNRVWSTYFRYALNELEKDSMLVSESLKANPDKGFIREHTVPFRVLRDKLMSIEYADFESVSIILSKFHVVTKITCEEDKKLKENGLGLAMPEDWDGENPFARYESVGISIYQESENS